MQKHNLVSPPWGGGAGQTATMEKVKKSKLAILNLSFADCWVIGGRLWSQVSELLKLFPTLKIDNGRLN